MAEETKTEQWEVHAAESPDGFYVERNVIHKYWIEYESEAHELCVYLNALEAKAALALKLAPYASHYGNCNEQSWKLAGRGKERHFVTCDCGLFQLLEEAGFREV